MQARVGPRGLGGGLGLLPGPRPVGVWSQEPLVFSQLIFQLRLPGSPEPHWAQERPGSAPVGEGRHIGCAPPPQALCPRLGRREPSLRIAELPPTLAHRGGSSSPLGSHEHTPGHGHRSPTPAGRIFSTVAPLLAVQLNSASTD